MSTKEDRAALKQAVHDKLLSLEEAELAAAIAHYRAYMADSRLDGREVHDKDDMVGSRENADLAAAFDAPVQAHHAKVDAIENTDFALTDTVEPGALVVLQNRSFIVCVSTARFEVNGTAYMGISPQSPIYQAMAGLKAGESFEHNGISFEIEDVL
ncbi:hypothetical protein SAMN05444007_10740 [Cribrihabitans marinus]|uniref:Transcription elongation factor, GreA/GreB family n=1 Tax=Cribrihabitans marinus TaxID=1227549 RepID=A0A1H7BGG8_9RHOB|nr:hypothetical protein [Cribrihabitans marinus]GGH34537.1 hypothetical protein GCM10010973_27320 [Cribrihabitans marinus]SEJ76711.1 hypothetical protein SAMN05444007_10740 [Cribrihabitans marinus]